MFTKNFNQLSKDDVDIAGGKGASLGEMTQAGIPVPSGFVLLAGAFDRFVSEAGLDKKIQDTLEKIDFENTESVDEASKILRDLIDQEEMPSDLSEEIVRGYESLGARFVAVRSSATAEDSATASWAGELESYLNTTEKTLLENVKKCWSSLFTPRAIFYRKEKDLLDTHVSVAVVIQEMIESEVSGIVFTVHPVTENRNQMIIEAGLGLGETIVSGSVTPDSFVVDKKELSITETNVSTQERKIVRCLEEGVKWVRVEEEEQNKQKLSDDQVLELADVCLKIEKHYEYPQDIEFAFRDEKFYIVQSRPITTLSEVNELENGRNVYKQLMNRGRSLIDCELWNIGEYNGLQEKSEGTCYFTALFHYVPGKGESVFYDMTDPKQNPSLLVKYFNLNKEKAFALKKDFYKDCDSIRSVIESKDINRIEELYKSLLNFCPICAIVNVLGDDSRDNINGLDEAILKEFLGMRKESDGVYHFGEMALVEMIGQKLPDDYKEYAKFILYREFIEDKLSPIEVLKKRQNGYIYHRSEIYTDISLNEYAKEQGLKMVANRDQVDISKIKDKIDGSAAYGGKVQGRVKVVFEREDMEKVNNGDILVTPMTTPDFISAMERSSAFVTDEGGTTCHASIVAREMAKPCIIGTIIATEVLKDGDLVEVDADEGVVRILEGKKVVFKRSAEISSSAASVQLMREREFNEKGFLDDSGLVGHGNDWMYVGRWESPPLEPSLFFGWHKTDFVKKVLPGLSLHGVFWVNHNAYLHKGDMLLLKDFLIEKYKNGTLSEWVDTLDVESKKIRVLHGEMIKNINREESVRKMIEVQTKYHQYANLVGGTIGMLVLDLAKEVEYVDTDVALFDLVHPHLRKTWIEEEQDVAREIARGVILKSGKDILEILEDGLSDKFAEYMTRFEWVGMDKWLGASMTRDKAIERIKEEVENIKSGSVVETEVAGESFKDLDSIVKLSVLTAYARASWAGDAARTQFYSKPVLTKIAESRGGSYEDLVQLSTSEIVELLNSKDFVFADKAEERRKGYAIYASADNKIIVRSGEDQIFKMLESEYGKAPKEVDVDFSGEIKGIGASKGRVAGRVRVVTSRDEFDLFEEGEILVTVETTPAFVPLMRRAKAILTDVGGITSHAAIVSRELRKPCVIATKAGTSVLHDGDLVEVNADEGVVRILKSGSQDSNEVEWFHWGQWPEPPFFATPWLSLISTEVSRKLDLKSFIKGDMKVIDGHVYSLKKDVDSFDRILRESFEGNNDFLEKVFDISEHEMDKMLGVKGSNDMTFFIYRMEEIIACTLVMFYGQFSTENYIKELCKKYKLDFETISALVKPKKPTIIEEFHGELRKIKEEDIDRVVSKYAWMGTRVLKGTPLTKEIALEAKKRLESEASPQEGDKNQEKLINLPRELKRVLDLASSMAYYRTRIVELIYISSFSLWPYLEKLAKDNNLVFDDFSLMTHQEMKEFLKNNKVPVNLGEREDGFGVSYINEEWNVFVGDKFEKELSKLNLDKVDENQKVFSGQVANKGKVRGVAKIVRFNDEVGKVEEGDIIFSPETTPDYIVAMQKAAAFVTDNGGITSHAAIIAREMKKPCIIGTKVATQLIKDGDLVEVNADKGVVRILERNNA